MKNEASGAPFSQPFIIDEATDTCWKALMENGNVLFKEENHQQAGKYYEGAFREAEDIFLSAQIGVVFPDACPAPMLVSSATNLAENHFRKGDGTRAINILSIVLDRLSTVLGDPGAPKEFVDECAYHLGYGVIKFTSLMNSFGATKEMISIEIDKTKIAFMSFATRQISMRH